MSSHLRHQVDALLRYDRPVERVQSLSLTIVSFADGARPGDRAQLGMLSFAVISSIALQEQPG